MKRPAELFPPRFRAAYRVARTGVQKTLGREVPDLYHPAHHERRAVFVHIPKAAGNTVNEIVFGAPSMDLSGHARAIEYRESSLVAFSRYFVFTFVRNPYARLYSAYRFLAAGGMTEEDRAFKGRHLDTTRGFTGFVERLTEDPEARDYWHFRPQHIYACDEFGRVIVDKVGRVETFDEDMSDICASLGVKYRPRWNNKSRVKAAPLEKVYDERAKAAAEALYTDDFRIFGYSAALPTA